MENATSMSIAWPDCSFTEEATYGSCADAHVCSLDVQDADRRFEDSAASSLGLQLDEWLTEDPIGSMEEMDCAHLFPAMLEHDSDCPFPFAMDNESAGASDALAWGSEDMDLNLIDKSNVFHGKSDQELVQNLADSFVSPPAITSHAVSITKIASVPPANWKKILVKKPFLDKAVERLGGGKDGAMELWKLIQVWLKHQKPQNGMSGSALTDCQDASFDTTTSGQQETVEDIPCLPSNADVCFQNRLSTKSPNNPKADIAASLFEGITGFNTPCTASTVSDQSNVSVESPRLPPESKMKVVVEVDHPPPVEVEDAAVRHKLASVENHNTSEGWKSHAATMQTHRQEHPRGDMVLATSMEMAPAASLPMAGAAVSEAEMSMWSCTTAASTRAARKNKMARQRRSLANHHARLGRTSCSPYQSLRSAGAYSNSFKCHRYLQSVDICSSQSVKAPKSEKNVRHFLQKELKPSEVGNLGRTYLPKKQSESYLPNRRAKEGIAISPKDINSGYKHWLQQKLNSEGSGTVGYGRSRPNKCQMHLLENTGDFVDTGFLEKEDYTMLYKDCSTSEKDVIWGKKVFQTDSSNVASSKTPMSEYAPRLDESCKEAVKNESSSSNIKLGTVGFLSSEAGKTKNSFYTKRKSLETSTTDEVSKALASTMGTDFPESSESVQSRLDCLMEDMLEEFENKLPVVERFPSLDTAAIAQFDEILELHNVTAAAAASECGSNCTQSLAAISDD